ncbi:uncharacterized protein DUF4238 [Jatrophihabitans sp. GAS493]|uniref:DUF4238 domain-containing protein n=1 Tax=Jatrophihabitans sp. GAS493 TaxID=1907575 RepID=UPI000BC0CECC|nr:DUF4238 domain-containing protein [Jatrophihabitans sp. GAS493]SOD72557.1 uncharacterized protein DUF4238 [Jatrophihabitans sp. GAS493]
MARQRLARRHHLVSRFYLRYFADDKERITTVMLPGDRVFTQSVSRASVENDFYTAVGQDGLETDAAERAFNEIEGPASQVWREIAGGVWPLMSTERGVVASWIALHLIRGSGTRAMMNEIGTDLLNLNIIVGGTARLRETLRDMGEPHDDESVAREWISLFEEPLAVEVNANHHLTQMVEMLPRVTESLLDRWWVLTTFERKGLATCDHPVHVVPNQRDLALGIGTGIETADQIHVPLTRRLSLGMAWRDALPAELAGQTDDIRQPGVAKVALFSNSCTVNNARSVIFHHPDDDPLKGLELHAPRTREVGDVDGDPWRFMPPADRQILIDAGLIPPQVGTPLDTPLP